MKLFHCFTQSNKKHIINGDYCLYCNKYVLDMFNKLKPHQRDIISNINPKNDGGYYYEEYVKLFNEFTNCPNGITEEEYIIKSIIE